MKSLTKEQQESYENTKICYIYKEKFGIKYLKGKKVNYVIIQGNIYVLRIVYVMQNRVHLKKIPIVLHNGSNYNYHFIIKQFTCLGESTEKIRNLYNANSKRSYKN